MMVFWLGCVQQCTLWFLDTAVYRHVRTTLPDGQDARMVRRPASTPVLKDTSIPVATSARAGFAGHPGEMEHPREMGRGWQPGEDGDDEHHYGHGGSNGGGGSNGTEHPGEMDPVVCHLAL